MGLDHDGNIQEEEYSRIFTTVGLRQLDFVKPAFDSIDLNRDGKISLDEFSTALKEYITTDDEESPDKLLWERHV